MFVRFVVHQKLSKSKHDAGVFVAAEHLREHGELSAEESKRLEDLLEWFRLHLPLPHISQRDVRAIYWYLPSAKQHISKTWELAQLLESHDYHVEMVTAGFVGLITYQDEYQIGAIPHIDRHR